MMDKKETVEFTTVNATTSHTLNVEEPYHQKDRQSPNFHEDRHKNIELQNGHSVIEEE